MPEYPKTRQDSLSCGIQNYFKVFWMLFSNKHPDRDRLDKRIFFFYENYLYALQSPVGHVQGVRWYFLSPKNFVGISLVASISFKIFTEFLKVSSNFLPNFFENFFVRSTGLLFRKILNFSSSWRKQCKGEGLGGVLKDFTFFRRP